MAHDDSKRQEALLLVSDGMSYREAGRTVGASASTVSRWVAENDKDEEEAGVVTEAEVVETLLLKSKLLLAGIETLKESKDMKDRADAVSKLLANYIMLVEDAAEEAPKQDSHITEVLLAQIMQNTKNGINAS